MRYVIAVLVALIACACSTVGPTPEQMQAMASLSSSLCIKSPGWNGSPVEVHYGSFGGKSTGTAGGGGKATCGASVLEFTNEGKADKPAPPK